MFARSTGLAALLAVGAFACAPAFAQQQPDPAVLDKIYCVYDSLIDTGDYEQVAEAFLYDDTPQADVDTAQKLVDTLATKCAETHKLGAKKKSIIADIGIYGASADYLAEDLVLIDDASAETVDAIFAMSDDLTDDEVMKLFDGSWRQDAAFTAKLKAALLAKGLPDNPETLEAAYHMLHLTSAAAVSATAFVLSTEAES